jgi:hypothetical protein
MIFGKKNFTLPSLEQTFGEEALDVFKKIGTKCAVTDFAILLGAYVIDDYYVSDDSSLKGRTGPWYLSSANEYGDVRDVSRYGSRSWEETVTRYGVVRPVLPYSNISDISTNVVRRKSGILEVEYGEYPQYVVDTSLGGILDSEFSAGRLRKTGKAYTTDSRRWIDYFEKFSPVKHEEFEYNGKRYVRVKSNCCGRSNYKLSNGAIAHNGDYYWLEVSPIVWYVDEEAKMLVSKTGLASGIRFCDRSYDGNFKNTEMYMFLNKCFAKDIKPLVMNKTEEISSDSKVDKSKEVNSNPKVHKIRELKEKILGYLKNHPQKEKIENYINELIKKYNSELEIIDYNIFSESKLSFYDEEGLYKKLLIQLETILSNLENDKEYYEVIEYINKCISILEGNKEEELDSLQTDLYNIKNIVLPFLGENGEKYSSHLISVLKNEKGNIEKYLNSVSFSEGTELDKCELKYKDKNEFINIFRKTIHPILEALNVSTIKRDITKEIMDSFSDILSNSFKQSRNKYISMQINTINSLKVEISKKIYEINKYNLGQKYELKLRDILSFNIDESLELIDIIKALNEKIVSLYKIELEIDEILKQRETVEKYRVQ